MPEPELTIVQAAARREALLQAVQAGTSDFELDLSGVSDVDSSGVQLLVALRHTLVAQGRPLILRGASPTVTEALATFGLSALFPVTAPALP